MATSKDAPAPGLEPAPSTSLRDLVRSAVIWRSGTQIVGQIITWGSTFLVIRILDPADYGLYAMAAVVLNLLSLINGFGIANAAIREGELQPHTIRQVFGMLVLLNAGLALVQFSAAGLIANYFGQPMVADLLRVQCLLYLTNPFSALAYALLSRRMDFRSQAQANLVSAILGAIVALGGAWLGMGVWALVAAPLTMFASKALLTTIKARAFILPSFSFAGSGHLARYGITVLGGSFAWFVATQTDILLGGRLLSAAELGFYTTALFLTQMFVTKFVPPINEIAFAAFARIQDDRDAVARSFLKAVRIVFLAAMPFCLGMSAVAEPMVAVLLGDKWAAAAPVVFFLGLAMPFMGMQVVFGPAVSAIGRPGITTQTSIIAAVLLTASYAVGLQWGMVGLAASWLVGYPLLIACSARLCLPVLGVSARDYLAALAPPLAAGLVMWASVRVIAPFTGDFPTIVQLAAQVALGGIVYCAVMLLIGRDRVLELLELRQARG
ncbi:lipopolysaccharide biosynthesis protein [Alteriqipengyuania sp. 357]